MCMVSVQFQEKNPIYHPTLTNKVDWTIVASFVSITILKDDSSINVEIPDGNDNMSTRASHCWHLLAD